MSWLASWNGLIFPRKEASSFSNFFSKALVKSSNFLNKIGRLFVAIKATIIDLPYEKYIFTPCLSIIRRFFRSFVISEIKLNIPENPPAIKSSLKALESLESGPNFRVYKQTEVVLKT